MAIEALDVVKEFLFPSRAKTVSIPPLDGGLTTNDKLEELAVPVGDPVPAPDDLELGLDGALYVSSGHEVLRAGPGDLAARTVHAALEGSVGPLALDASGALLAGVAGTGVVRIDADGHATPVVTSVDGTPVACPTALAVGPDGALFVTEGSNRHRPDDWARDLMERNADGRLVRIDGGGQAQVIARGLAWPSGLAVAPDGESLLMAEAWAHRLSSVPLGGGRPAVVHDNLPGYPGRLALAADGYWLTFFALRTHLVEFVLRQRDYREAMMATIEPDYWIRPALRTLNTGLEPLQGGQIRKLGVLKPWAPPRSYGLVARLGADGEASASWHSRMGGRHHGITGAREHEGRLYLASKGGDVVLALEVDR